MAKVVSRCLMGVYSYVGVALKFLIENSEKDNILALLALELQ